MPLPANPLVGMFATYPFVEIEKQKRALIDKGVDVIDLSIGDPRELTPSFIVEAIRSHVPARSSYPTTVGRPALRAAIAGWFHRRHGVTLDPDRHILPANGSKEAVFNIHLALLDPASPRRRVLIPSPAYPVYERGAAFAGGVPTLLPLTREHGYLPDLGAVPKAVWEETALLWLNYPHNPTGATATQSYWEQVVDWCHKTDTVLLSDDCYIDIYDAAIDLQPLGEGGGLDHRPMCPLQLSSDRVLTFMSLSKRSGMTGYRAGFVAGDHDIIKAFLRARANFGVGQPEFVQKAAVVAWDDDEHVRERRKIFTSRIKAAAPVFQNLGMLSEVPKAAFYLWVKIPRAFGTGDVQFALGLAERGVICSPSSWLSESIKGYARFALVPDVEPTLAALDIIKDYINN